MDDYEDDIKEIIAEESFDPIVYLRSGYQTVVYCIGYFFYIIQLYGWHIVFGGILFYYTYNKFLNSFLNSMFGRFNNYIKKKEEREYDAKYHKNPDLFAERISAQQAFAQKLQEKYDQQAKEYQKKLKEKEERKRQEVLNLLNNQGGQRLGGRGDDGNSQPKSFKPEYNPLMGPGSSSNYRPPKKSKCGGGGCG